jgi:DNA mismatch repair protein MutL
MSKIRILPELISNKIAAGEVVERPASVVKELMENALDADSRRLIVEVDKGGRSLIRVSDDGSGMNHDDALLALERYATSKIYSDADLFSINTLGFRGEALPSIASVSRLTLVTRPKDSDSGTEIRVEGGKIKQVSEVGAPPGTMVSVAHLFYNTPARRKFLKTVNTEMGHIADIVASIALGRPDVQFRLIHNSKTVKSWPAAADQTERVLSVLGTDMHHEIFNVEKSHGDVAVSGWISSPRMSRKTTRGTFIFVNGRFVRDRVIQHALFEGYTQRLVKGQFPVAVLYITVPFDQVDVNVHPTKSEVRFAKHRMVHDLVKSAVAETLDRQDRPQWEQRNTGAEGPWDAAQRSKLKAQSIVGEARTAFDGRSGFRADVKPAFKDRGSRIQYPVGSASGKFHRARPASDTDTETWDFEPGTRREQTDLWTQKRFADLVVIGQIHNTYIVCESEEGLILIDQHAAHERIMYEQLKRRSEGLKAQAQKLLVPETVELGYREAAILEKLLPKFEGIGLEIEPFGGNTFVIKTVPELLVGREIKPLVQDVVEELAANGFSAGPAQSIDECLKLMACHSTIRARQALDEKQLQGLLSQLDQCENPSHCPHGRPTWIRWTVNELEKAFNQIV